LAIVFPICGSAAVLEIEAPDVSGRARLRSQPANNWFHTLFASENLSAWTPISRFQGWFDFLDPRSGLFPRRFYLLRADANDASPNWKNQVNLEAGEQFLSQPSDWMGLSWVKFIILLDEPWRVYFQSSSRYGFHYDFAVAELPVFRGMSLAEFDRSTLYRDGQQAVLGALVVPKREVSTNEYGIQFVGRDPYPPASVAAWFDLVRSTVLPRSARAIYMPVFEQRNAALDASDFFREQGVALGSVERWVSGDVCYSSGWAVGRLVFVSATRIQQAYEQGELKSEDILLTDEVPAELPLVAGIVTLTLATPNSHVAILANSFQEPFAYLQPSRTNGLDRLVGKEAMLICRANELGCQVQLIDLDGQLDPKTKEEFARLRVPPPIQLVAKEPRGVLAMPTDQLSPTDIKYVGGKAANFGIVRRALPDNSPEAIALTFDLWDGFLDQTLPSGRTLRTEISARLDQYSYPANLVALRADLDAIKRLIRDTARFDRSQQEQILQALAPFRSKGKIRFRSSTNVEDTEAFTGAGLYDSYSGCLEDDLDADDEGPSQCDPNEPEERGVFRAMQKVFANVDLTYTGSDGQSRRLSGYPSSWPKASTRIDGLDVITEWEMDQPVAGTRLELRVTDALKPVQGSDLPVKTLSAFGRVTLTAHYPEPVPSFGSTSVVEEAVYLKPQLTQGPTSTLKSTEFKAGNLSIQTKYLVVDYEICAGCTYDLVEFLETRIQGATSEEIILRDYFSQSYTTEHTGPTRFIFEPRLDPGVGAETLSELVAANIKLFLVDNNKIWIMGLDGRLREVTTAGR